MCLLSKRQYFLISNRSVDVFSREQVDALMNSARALAASAELPDDAELTERFLREHCGETLDAVDLLCNWVNE